MRTIILVILSALALRSQGQDPLDSMMQALAGQRGTERVRTLGDIQWELGFSDPEKALAYGLEAMKLAEGMADSAVIAQASNDFSITQYRLGHFQRAIDLNRRALRIRQVARDTMGIAASHNKIGACFIELMMLDSALVHNYAAERIYESRKDVLHAAQMRGNIARLYQQLGNVDMALKVARETVTMLQGEDNDYAMGNALGQLAMILTDTQDTLEAEETSLRALAIFERIGAKADIASISNILGMLYRGRGDHEAGLRYYRKALDMATEVGDLTGQATFLLNIANVLADQGELTEAAELYRRSIAISEREGYIDPRMTALSGYVDVLARSGRPAEALAQQGLLLMLRDSVYKRDRISALSDMQVKYETERTEKELAQERERTLAQQARISRQRMSIAFISTAALFVILLAFIRVSRQRSRLRAERDAAVIAEREQGFRNMVERMEAERRRIAHELHDGIGQQIGGLRFRLEGAAQRDPGLNDLLTIVDDAGKEVRGLAHQMMPRALEAQGLAPAIADMLHKSLDRPGMRHRFDAFGVEDRMPQPVETGVYRIAQELTSNVIRHSGATEVNVQLLRNKGHLVLMVEDNGRGFDPVAAGQGLGLQGMRDRARLIGGTLHIERGAGHGTIATLRVPLDPHDRT